MSIFYNFVFLKINWELHFADQSNPPLHFGTLRACNYIILARQGRACLKHWQARSYIYCSGCLSATHIGGPCPPVCLVGLSASMFGGLVRQLVWRTLLYNIFISKAALCSYKLFWHGKAVRLQGTVIRHRKAVQLQE